MVFKKMVFCNTESVLKYKKSKLQLVMLIELLCFPNFCHLKENVLFNYRKLINIYLNLLYS